MLTITYNKAVRDKIPEIIEKSGKKVKVIVLEDEEFLHHLKLKLKEELNEYEKSGKIEELTDIVEVIYNILRIKGIFKTEFERIRQNKNEKRGSFQKNLFLIEVS